MRNFKFRDRLHHSVHSGQGQQRQTRRQPSGKMAAVKEFIAADIRLFFLPVTAVWNAVIRELKA